jgi:hypothetical protein
MPPFGEVGMMIICWPFGFSVSIALQAKIMVINNNAMVFMAL